MKHTNAALKKSAAVPLSIQRMQVRDGKANVLFHVGPSIDTADKLEAAVLAATDGKARMLRGSAHHPVNGNTSLIVAKVALNLDIRPCDDVGAAGMTAVTANVFRDESDFIWKRHGEGETAVLVRESDDDLEAVLERRKTHSIVTASARVVLHETAKIGNVIAWYDADREKMRSGVICGEIAAASKEDESAFCVFDLSTQVVHEVARDDVFAVADNSLSREIANARTSLFDPSAPPLTKSNYLSKHLAYMAILYRNNETYFQRLKALIEKGFGAAAVRQAT